MTRVVNELTPVSSTGHRMAAVTVADVVEYSRHLARDEDGTLARLVALRRNLVAPALESHGGRLVKTLGDGILAEFPEAGGALACAAIIQERLRQDNLALPRDERIECRIGIHSGEIIDVAGDIYGTTVNVASRLESLATPGAICVSAAVIEQARGLIAGAPEDLGPTPLKNIDQPVHIYILRPDDIVAESGPHVGAGVKRWRRPSVAVLPFEVVSHTPEDAYFGEGLAEDLISALSRCRWFFVISRNSSFSLAGARDDIQRVATRLGVRYVVDGTVRRSGSRLRVTARLVDGDSGTQIWAARYDRESGDIFVIQDEIVEAIATTVEPELELSELLRARRKRPERLEAQDCFYHAHWHFHLTNREDNETAKTWYRRAIEQEPSFARAIAGLAYTCYADAVFGYAADARAAVAEGLDLARQAVALDPNDAFAHTVLGRLYMLAGRHDASIAELRRALELNPSNARAHYGLGFSLVMNGQPEQGLPLLERAQRLSPHDPLLWAFLTVSALAHQLLGAVAEAEYAARRAVDSPNVGFWAWLQLAVALGYRGKRREAGEALAEARTSRPDFSVAMLDRIFVFRDPAHRRVYVDGLTAAGLDETVTA